MGKVRALFPQGAPYSFGLGALSGDTQGSVPSSPHNRGPNVLGGTPAKASGGRLGVWQDPLVLRKVGGSLEGAGPCLGPCSGLCP